MQTTPPPAIIVPASPATSPSVLPDGDVLYLSAGRHGRTDVTKVTIYRKDAVVVVACNNLDTWLSGLDFKPIMYALNYQSGFFHLEEGVRFTQDSVITFGGQGQPVTHKPQPFLAPSTAWALVNNVDLGAVVALPAQLQNCGCTNVTGVDYFNAKLELFHVAHETDLPRPATVPENDLVMTLTNARASVTEWYDPQTLIPDGIIQKPGITYTRQRTN